MNSTSAPPADALVADAIARIEERRVALDLLADKGMEMAERLAAGETVGVAGRKLFDDPAWAFAVISRAVRLCLALASRLDEALIDLLRGGPIPNLAILAPEAPRAAKAPMPVPAPLVEEPAPSNPRARIARAVDAAIKAEGERESAERARAYVQEHLIEGEEYDALLHQPWRVVVQAICADLGLKPDWGAWDNEEGFSATPLKPLIPVKAGTQIIDPGGGGDPDTAWPPEGPRESAPRIPFYDLGPGLRRDEREVEVGLPS